MCFGTLCDGPCHGRYQRSSLTQARLCRSHDALPDSLADLITPNIAEAEALIGGRITKAQEAKEAAYAMAQKFKTPCLLKGGHLPEKGKVVDYLATGAEVIFLFFSLHPSPTNPRNGLCVCCSHHRLPSTILSFE